MLRLGSSASTSLSAENMAQPVVFSKDSYTLRGMEKQHRILTPIILTFVKKLGEGCVVLGLPNPAQSAKQLFQLIIKSPV
ncbi:hypothetical protein DRW42_25440 [Pedobacter miscanthi]|uniref:Uncharacterized protein n=1 Tax=Pedobacter miscanthi TaxID=2259170 RepID=A0A366KLW2_9SPHI|nr:hypothetical protein DRW42_25440 [Pedobacter miscanthi]